MMGAGAVAGVGADGGETFFRQQLELPPNLLVRDAFTPRGELTDLRLGQTWTIPVYRPFPPNSPVQIVEARVERHEIIIWNGDDVETKLLVYRSDAGSGIHATREPIGREWIRADGTVLRQEIALSGLKLLFERLPDEALEPRRQLMDAEQHPQLWRRSSPAPPSPRGQQP
jgi:hypothetical protein